MSTPIDSDVFDEDMSPTNDDGAKRSVNDGDGSSSAEINADSTAAATTRRRTRTARTFPAASFIESLALAEAIQTHAAGQRVRRLTLFDQMGRSADSGTSRKLVTNSSQYGITKGSYQAEFLELTETGALASGDDSLGRAKLAARLQLAIADVVPFNPLYDQFKNNRLPATGVLRDFVIEHSLSSEDNADECIETFLANCRDLGLLTNYAGAERLLTFEILLDEAATGMTEPAEFGAGERSREKAPEAEPRRLVSRLRLLRTHLTSRTCASW